MKVSYFADVVLFFYIFQKLVKVAEDAHAEHIYDKHLKVSANVSVKFFYSFHSHDEEKLSSVRVSASSLNCQYQFSKPVLLSYKMITGKKIGYLDYGLFMLVLTPFQHMGSV